MKLNYVVNKWNNHYSSEQKTGKNSVIENVRLLKSLDNENASNLSKRKYLNF